jgi:hypothetical protein
MKKIAISLLVIGILLSWAAISLAAAPPLIIKLKGMPQGDVIPDTVKQYVIDDIKSKTNWETKFGLYVDRTIINDYIFYRYKASIYDVSKNSEFKDPGIVVVLKMVNKEDAKYAVWITLSKATIDRIKDPKEKENYFKQVIEKYEESEKMKEELK